MDIRDFTKKLVKFAKGFEYTESDRDKAYDTISFYKEEYCYTQLITIREWKLYSKLLHRAKEGINDYYINNIPNDKLIQITIENGTIQILNDHDELVDIFLINQDYKDTEYMTQEEQALEDALKKAINIIGDKK